MVEVASGSKDVFYQQGLGDIVRVENKMDAKYCMQVKQARVLLLQIVR